MQAGKLFLDKTLDEYGMADIEFEVQGRRFLAHRAFLTSRSTVFSTMLCGRFNNAGVVDIADCSAESFRCLLEYLYTDHTDIQSNDMCELLALGTRYEVPRLVGLCELYLSIALAEQVHLARLTPHASHLTPPASRLPPHAHSLCSSAWKAASLVSIPEKTSSGGRMVRRAWKEPSS